MRCCVCIALQFTAKTLVGGGVQSIFFWPKEPEFKQINEKYKGDLKNVIQIFRSSSTFMQPHVPLIDDKLTDILCQRTRRQKCKECRNSILKASLEKEMVKYWNDCDMPVSPSKECIIGSALQIYTALLNCNHGTFIETEELSLDHVTHSLQLCFLMAARSDDPANGIGAIIYDKQKQYIVGAGYNGYIKQALYGNFPRRGRGYKQQVAKGKFMVHAEVNAILFRSAEDLDSAVLFSSKIPCNKCEKMIIASGIKTVVAVKEIMKPTEGAEKPGCTTGTLEGKGLGKCVKDSEGEPKISEEKNISENMQQTLAVNKESDFEIMLWEIPSDQQVAEQCSGQSNTQPQSESPDVGTNYRLPEKENLMIFLALHMERSPLCEAPEGSGKYSKTGIAVLNTTEKNHIVAIECSRNGLHAVEQVLLSSPRSLHGCTVYLSRYPCIICAKLLIQGGVDRICYWPNLEQQDNQNKGVWKNNLTSVSQLFPKARVICDMCIPLLNLNTIKEKVSPKARVIPTEESIKCESFFDVPDVVDDTMEALGLSHLKDKDYVAKYMSELQNANDCYRALINSSCGFFETNSSVAHANNAEGEQPSKLQENEKKHIHALQLCFLLAARTDSPDYGAGALISQKDCFVGVGYNGFPKGSHRGKYLSKENSASSLLICAEANALCFRYKQDLQEATLYSSIYPCPKCMKLIKIVGGITKIVCVKPKDCERLHPAPKGTTYWMWKQDLGIPEGSRRCLVYGQDPTS
ncbi:cytidine and dCMP deaminase domain-containing protein 1-like [Hypanus sabinus]|uniref:cytidine and dCMP deaminase domain-containing protein 1-like n=1 Tax=Hypanus sabinus TaxID=79690 RepID=UPI0028C4CCD8|nr:cytidine and dCMP deaminase domain-containing protein 1-like [Hypanus sabinus]